MNEIWKPVPGYKDYEVSSLGNVRSWRKKGNTQKQPTKPRYLKQGISGDGKYAIIKLYLNNKGHTQRVHRLVLESFVGPMPKGEECRHLNGNSRDNRLANLSYGTHLENMADQKAHGTAVVRVGEDHSQAILDERGVREIRSRYAAGGETYRSLGTEYGVDSTTIGYIIRGKLWKHIL